MRSLGAVELLVEEMEQEVDVEAEAALEEGDELVSLELGLEEVLDGDGAAGAGHLDVAAAALELEHAHLVAGDGQVDATPVAVRDSLPRYYHPLLRQLPHTVLI